MSSANKIKNWIEHYKQLGYTNLKIVMNNSCLNEIKEDSQLIISQESHTFMGLPIEIYDGIEGTDFYVTEKL